MFFLRVCITKLHMRSDNLWAFAPYLTSWLVNWYDFVYLQTFDAYVVGKENAPGVVVLQEWWGVDYEVKNHAIHISQIGDGYRALIPEYDVVWFFLCTICSG